MTSILKIGDLQRKCAALEKMSAANAKKFEKLRKDVDVVIRRSEIIRSTREKCEAAKTKKQSRVKFAETEPTTTLLEEEADIGSVEEETITSPSVSRRVLKSPPRPASTNPWVAFQKRHKGEKMTKKQRSALYKREKAEGLLGM